MTAKAGWFFQKGVLDFAGGTVVHINAAIAGLVGSFVIGKRLGFGKESLKPHNMVHVMTGAALLWFGWFGFNAGSALEANGTAALAFANTLLATAAAVLAWTFAEWLLRGKPSLLGAASGCVAGLVAVTPAAGFVGPMGALVIGALAGLLCIWGVSGLKKLLGSDDSLDVFGIHGVGGILGALLTAVFAAPKLGGTGIYDYVTNAAAPDYSIVDQFLIQGQSVLVTLAWSGVVAYIAFKIADLVFGLRVPEDQEREGLDITSHGESAYEN
jgi:Amt family ammonium transporter